MRLVAITRLRNEEDIVEAFARHHHALVDHHVFLDNDSNDRTVEILRSLQQEGLPITIFSSRSVSFTEALHATVMLQLTVQREKPDWVLLLDADEFLDVRVVGPFVGKYLERVSPAVGCLKMGVVHYRRTEADEQGESVVPLRLRWRMPERTGLYKVMVRAGLVGENVSVEAGNREVLYNGRPIGAEIHEDLVLAHYPERSAWQALAKMAIGRLQVLAAGQREIMLNRNSRYDPVLALLREAPERLLLDDAYMQGRTGADLIINDPITYLGGALQYTRSADAPMRAVQSLMAYTEALATQHGRLVDTYEAVREQIDRQARTFTHLT